MDRVDDFGDLVDEFPTRHRFRLQLLDLSLGVLLRLANGRSVIANERTRGIEHVHRRA